MWGLGLGLPGLGLGFYDKVSVSSQNLSQVSVSEVTISTTSLTLLLLDQSRYIQVLFLAYIPIIVHHACQNKQKNKVFMTKFSSTRAFRWYITQSIAPTHNNLYQFWANVSDLYVSWSKVALGLIIHKNDKKSWINRCLIPLWAFPWKQPKNRKM